MKTLHTYLTRQVLASLLITVAVFTFVLLLGNVLKEVLPLLVNGQVSVGVFAHAAGLLIPFVWVFALPMGMLTATLLIFGRFSADQELTAVRASGISLLSIVTPVLLLSLAFCALSALVDMEVGPRCRVAYNRILDELRVELAKVQLPEGRFIKDFKDYIFYIGKNRHGQLQDVMVFQLQDETNVLRTIRAQRGKVELDVTNRMLNVLLFDGSLIEAHEGGEAYLGGFESVPIQLDLSPARNASRTLRVDDMTFGQLREELRNLERVNLPISRRSLAPEQLRATKAAWEKRRRDMITPVLFQMHKQVAFSFACFGFTLLGIPLGIRVHRRETNIGVAIALLLVAVYYSFVLLAQSLDTRPECAPYLIVWVPNFLFQTVGAVLLWRANRC